MFKLWIVEALCDQCGKCGVIFPRFYKEQPIIVNKTSKGSEEVMAAAKRLIDCCPHDAVKMREV